ncbi:MAG: hypothetical protein R3F55_20360 [Alphaproteobacteria bacterium]
MKAAALTSNLLARKGEARPSLALTVEPVETGPAKPAVEAAAHGHAGGFATIMRPSLGRPVAPVEAPPRPATGGGGPGGGPQADPVRMTLRLDRERHRKLKILAAHRGLTVQQVLVMAIDGMVSRSPQSADGRPCACLNASSQQPAPTRPAPVAS